MKFFNAIPLWEILFLSSGDKSLVKEQFQLNKRSYSNSYIKTNNKSDLNSNNLNSSIYTFYLNKMDSNYVLETSNERKIIDYISLMTDEFLIREYEANCR